MRCNCRFRRIGLKLLIFIFVACSIRPEHGNRNSLSLLCSASTSHWNEALPAGNFRIRSYAELTSEEGSLLLRARGENKNPFLQTPEIKGSEISEELKLQGLKITVSYFCDRATDAGQRMVLLKK